MGRIIDIFVLLLMFPLVMWGGVTSAQDCVEANLCFELFDRSDALTVVRLEPRGGDIRFFRNPMLRAELVVNKALIPELQDNPEIEVQFNTPVELTNLEDSCNLLLLGLSDTSDEEAGEASEASNFLQTSVRVPLADNGESFVGDMAIHAFCQDNNLPNTSENLGGNLPPPGTTVYDAATTEDTLANLVESVIPAAEVETLRTRLLDNDACAAAPGESVLTSADLATQFAVFIIYSPAGVDMAAAWEQFHGTEDSSIYRRDYAGIHCLLDTPSSPPTVDLICDPTCEGAVFDSPHTVEFEAAISGDVVQRTFELVRQAPDDSETDTILFQGDEVPPDALVFSEPGRYVATFTVEGLPVAYDGAVQAVEETTLTDNESFTVMLPDVSQVPVYRETVVTNRFGSFTLLETVLTSVVLIVGAVTGVSVLLILADTRFGRVVFAVAIVLTVIALLILGNLGSWREEQPSPTVTVTPAVTVEATEGGT